ncbi:Asp-tRNA(Asn)/Glu-tRNA(Gln) amidotransferase subunit GatC [Ignavigranum ruoffiae]|uniref:Asp-tRNA(Asn)/Glu-tRNA(Gln) amidotransferase subunit GatC n=1 Tax=Ignavigranum ruoffiae TaxID=89093 RepID=UPI002061A63D|nr:Asp-tRNA(Asn)/Glu-tRNA(Gln) amidotransferase subunit GatC [Ignavigranum ruoffiae]UPQ85185.1 Asp-tRNA(Asn)/Glu-tRNA(Gln) amidotransferase subunit GatC [Ignavigranum ruoffiae]
MLNQEDIQRLAGLAKLVIAEDELESYTDEIGRIMALVQELQVIDTEGIEPTFHGNQKKNVFREDQAVPSDLPEAMLANAPDSEDGFIRVPVIIESEEA